MPKTCACCGGPIRLSRDNYQQHWENGETWFWHTTCEPP